ncbi:MAG: ATP-grasp domain-containing protein [Leptospiraceae bacterium]|nr:ATP-grasp domain-containing protein [Leptospiraceae bacterium]MCP5497628.1 ATP-grasp domain-containing protein [Leptospiraceae bacterium]
MKREGFFVSIGAGTQQLPLIQACKLMGIKVISIDKNPSAPGFKLSDIKIIESITEYRKIYNKLLGLTSYEPIIGIGCRSYGKATYTASYLVEKFKLIGNKSEVIQKFSDKKSIKNYLAKFGVPIPKQFNINPNATKSKGIAFPCIFKPSDGAGKQGIELFDSFSPLKKKILLYHEKNQPYFVEEFIPGLEITILGFVYNGKFYYVSVSDKITSGFPPFLEICHKLPCSHQNLIGELKLVCQTIVEALKLENSPFVAEFKITDKKQFYLMEIVPEIGGEYLAEHLVKEFYDYDYFENYVKLMIGDKPDFNQIHHNGKNKYHNSQIYFVTPPQGKSKFLGMKRFVPERNERVFLDIPLKKEGSIVNTKDGNSCRIKVLGISDCQYTNTVPNIEKRIEVQFE